jgi:protein-tyrosine phosphatase
MPRCGRHWQQLEEAGIRSRFSCCYPEEESALIIPPGWRSERVSLPDHRQQEPLMPERLALALARAEALVGQAAPVYLHCMAGYERSPLLAVGLTARLRGIDPLAALAWVRRCHPMAMPIYDHLVMLEILLSARQAPGEQRGIDRPGHLPGERKGP